MVYLEEQGKPCLHKCTENSGFFELFILSILSVLLKYAFREKQDFENELDDDEFCLVFKQGQLLQK